MTAASLDSPPARSREQVLRRRVRWVVSATITYNVIEAVIALTAGTVASSTALIAFGLDSVVEVLSAAAVAWQFAAPDPARRERAALRLIAISFFGLAAFVSVDAVRALMGAGEAEHSSVGIMLAAVSVAVMPALSWFERRTGRELGSASTVADSKQTLLCSYLSGVLLVGLLLNSTLGWSWADPIAALIIAAVAVNEGLEAWRGDACCTPAHILTDADTSTSAGTGSGDSTEAVGTPAADETSDHPEDSPAPALAPAAGGCDCCDHPPSR